MSPQTFERPGLGDRVFNRVFGWLIGLGIGLAHNHLLVVRGRISGQLHSTPVDVLYYRGTLYLVAPRGQTQWVRNALASGVVTLRKGRLRDDFTLRLVDEDKRPAILKAYLDRFKPTVQRFFPVPAGSPEERFVPLASRYPVLALTPVQ